MNETDRVLIAFFVDRVREVAKNLREAGKESHAACWDKPNYDANHAFRVGYMIGAACKAAENLETLAEAIEKDAAEALLN